MFLCLMTILENFPQIYYYEVLNLRKESYAVQHPNPCLLQRKSSLKHVQAFPLVSESSAVLSGKSRVAELAEL